MGTLGPMGSDSATVVQGQVSEPSQASSQLTRTLLPQPPLSRAHLLSSSTTANTHSTQGAPPCPQAGFPVGTIGRGVSEQGPTSHQGRGPHPVPVNAPSTGPHLCYTVQAADSLRATCPDCYDEWLTLSRNSKRQLPHTTGPLLSAGSAPHLSPASSTPNSPPCWLS